MLHRRCAVPPSPASQHRRCAPAPCTPAPPLRPAARSCHGCLLKEGSTPNCLYREMRVATAHTLRCGHCCWGGALGACRGSGIHPDLGTAVTLSSREKRHCFHRWYSATEEKKRRCNSMPMYLYWQCNCDGAAYLSVCVLSCPVQGRSQMAGDAPEPRGASPGVWFMFMQDTSMALSGLKYGAVKLSENLGQNWQSHAKPQ